MQIIQYGNRDNRGRFQCIKQFAILVTVILGFGMVLRFDKPTFDWLPMRKDAYCCWLCQAVGSARENRAVNWLSVPVTVPLVLDCNSDFRRLNKRICEATEQLYPAGDWVFCHLPLAPVCSSIPNCVSLGNLASLCMVWNARWTDTQNTNRHPHCYIRFLAHRVE